MHALLRQTSRRVTRNKCDRYARGAHDLRVITRAHPTAKARLKNLLPAVQQRCAQFGDRMGVENQKRKEKSRCDLYFARALSI